MKALHLLRAVRDLPLPPPPPSLTSTDKLVLAILAMRADASGFCWTSYTTIAANGWMGLRTAKTAIARLASAGLVEICVRREQGSQERAANGYRVRVEIGVSTDDAEGVLPPHDVVPPRHEGGAVTARQEVPPAHDVVPPQHDRVPPPHPVGAVTARQEVPPPHDVVPPRHEGSAVTPRQGVRSWHDVVPPRHEGSAVTARQVVPLPHGGGAVTAHRSDPRSVHSSAPGRSFALTGDPGASSKRSKPRKKPKHTPEQIGTKNEIVEAFADQFQAAKGVRPKSLDAADHAAAFRLAKTFGADEACRIIRRAFEHPFVVENNATLKYIASRADTYRGSRPNGASQAFVSQRPPATGSAWPSLAAKGRA